jgi:hypothetical protein
MGISIQKIFIQGNADVIKANANPNLHLNELNPDKALHLLVDKTDLIKSSTEFCFLPTGIFEIESQGLVLKPREDFDSLMGNGNIVKGRRKIITELRLYELFCQRTQKDFYGGDFGQAGYETNTNQRCESGSEPDQGLAPYENNFESYVRLATMGGSLVGEKKKKGTLRHSPISSDHEWLFDSVLHAHYDLDFWLHHSNGTTERRPLTEKAPPADAPSDPRDEKDYNAADYTEQDQSFSSPYCAWYQSYDSSARFRVARGYIHKNSFTVSLSAPTDQRVDGVIVNAIVFCHIMWLKVQIFILVAVQFLIG